MTAPAAFPDLAPMDVGGRASRVRAAAAAAGCDALVVTNLVNVRYLTGFTGSAGLAWLGPDELVLVTDRRYAEQVHSEIGCSGADVRIEITNDEPRELLVAAAVAAGRIGLEAAAVSWADQRKYDEWFGPAELVTED
ncbi:MAG: aminopeptidase P family N-terminal domain-containing protein, partial [bacterium]|nr:aminopeptidase P family N-terminal domain-containing protein [bacterium]